MSPGQLNCDEHEAFLAGELQFFLAQSFHFQRQPHFGFRFHACSFFHQVQQAFQAVFTGHCVKFLLPVKKNNRRAAPFQQFKNIAERSCTLTVPYHQAIIAAARHFEIFCREVFAAVRTGSGCYRMQRSVVQIVSGGRPATVHRDFAGVKPLQAMLYCRVCAFGIADHNVVVTGNHGGDACLHFFVQLPD